MAIGLKCGMSGIRAGHCSRDRVDRGTDAV